MCFPEDKKVPKSPKTKCPHTQELQDQQNVNCDFECVQVVVFCKSTAYMSK